MSRLTATQIIAQGDYLLPDFDPTILTVSQLLGILSYHDIVYPSPYSKPKLLQLFNAEIKQKTSKFTKERLRKENSLASDDGITDGLTGKPLSKPKAPVRRSSRRSSRTPEEAPVVLPDPPKRRRSSAQPSLGGPSRSKFAANEEILVEESEPEEHELPARKVRRKKTTDGAEKERRRVSQADDSGWDDNNIFQSGAESSSPIRPPSVRSKHRSSLAPKKSRKSMSAPPQLSPQAQHFTPPKTKFEPELSPLVQRETRLLAPKFNALEQSFVPSGLPQSFDFKEEHSDEESPDELDGLRGVSPPPLPDDNFEEEDEAAGSSEEDVEDGQVVAIQKTLSGDRTVMKNTQPQSGSGAASILLRFLVFLVIMASSAATIDYKTRSAEIGYCNKGQDTSSALETIRTLRLAEDLCRRENHTFLYPETRGDITLCPPPHLVPFQPNECTPCPEHGECTQFSVACDNGYLLRSHPLLFFVPPVPSRSQLKISPNTPPLQLGWALISTLLDGLPGFGSVALPPRCVQDPQRRRNIGLLGKAIETELANERGERACSGDHDDKTYAEDQGGAARQWGMELKELEDRMKVKTAPALFRFLDSSFEEAIQELVQWGGVILGEDESGTRYLAHKTPKLTLWCALTIKSRETWKDWQTTLFSFIALLSSGFLLKFRRDRNLIEGRRVADLVQIALDMLRNQELAYHTDPVSTAQPYLSSIQLRDLVLQDEHSISSRKRLWDQVEKVVEGNANVRANLEEISAGDELRVWRWVGGGRRSEIRPRTNDESF